MKKTRLTVALAATLALSLTCSSCIGSFALTNRMLSWNRQISNKFVNELVFFAFWVVPVYEVTVLADVLVINSIEFWSGTNPVACGTRVIQGEHDRYLVECDGRGYTIKGEHDSKAVRLEFCADENSWSVIDPVTGEAHKFLTYLDDSHVRMPGFDGSEVTVELSQAGLMAYSAAAQASNVAMR